MISMTIGEIGIDGILRQVAETRETIREAKELIEKAEATRDKELIAAADVLFDLAGIAEGHDLEIIAREWNAMKKRGGVNIEDLRLESWNGDSEDVQLEWNGTEFVGQLGRPTIWFWTKKIACFYYSNSGFSLPRGASPLWIIFSTDRVVSELNEREENGTEEKNRNLH